MKGAKKPIYGVGINDADYVVKPVSNGVRNPCQFYVRWVGMLSRCYSASVQDKRPSYIGCSVCPEWLVFSNFKSWLIGQDWEGKELDKDLLVKGNKVYSPNFCLLVDPIVNTFLNEIPATRGDMPLGVGLIKSSGRYWSHCSNPFTKKRDYLGSFSCPKAAHEKWRKRKHELACQLANVQSNEVVATALRNRYEIEQ